MDFFEKHELTSIQINNNEYNFFINHSALKSIEPIIFIVSLPIWAGGLLMLSTDPTLSFKARAGVLIIMALVTLTNYILINFMSYKEEYAKLDFDSNLLYVHDTEQAFPISGLSIWLHDSESFDINSHNQFIKQDNWCLSLVFQDFSTDSMEITTYVRLLMPTSRDIVFSFKEELEQKAKWHKTIIEGERSVSDLLDSTQIRKAA